MEKIYCANGKHKKTEGFNNKDLKTDMKISFIIISFIIHQDEGTIITNVYAPNNRASKHLRQNLTVLKRKTDN